jgi:hypothetical protein
MAVNSTATTPGHEIPGVLQLLLDRHWKNVMLKSAAQWDLALCWHCHVAVHGGHFDVVWRIDCRLAIQPTAAACAALNGACAAKLGISCM